MFNDVECFKSTHILHTCLCIVISLVLILLTFIMILLFVESRKQSGVILSKISAKVEIIVMFIKLILLVIFLFLQDSSFRGFKIIVLVLVSTVSFLRYHLDRPYYYMSMNKIASVLHGIFAWTNYLILLGALIGSILFNMLLFIYLMGIPIIIALILTSRSDAHMKTLLTPVSKF